MYCARILVIAVAAAAWTRITLAQPPLSYQSGEAQPMESKATQPGVGKDWRRFGSGLEVDHPIGASKRRLASAKDSHRIASVARFGSGLEDDAPVRPISVFRQSGLEGLASIQTPAPSHSAVRFGSGLEEDRPLPSVARFPSEDDHPIAMAIRFGSGLEDDAPVRSLKLLYQPGF